MGKQVEPKRGRGRPATGETPRRIFRMDDEAWARIELAAKQSGETVSEWVRKTLSKAADRLLK